MIRFRKILCPVDFSPASHNAAAYAARIAGDFGAKLKLLHVVPPLVPLEYNLQLNLAPIIEEMQRHSERQIKEWTTKLRLSGATVESEVRSGDTFAEIQKAMKAYAPDLVAVGSHGRRGFERWIIGSTAERLLRHSAVPLLITPALKKRGEVHSKFERILVTTDLSKVSSVALGYALAIAQKNRARLTLFHVLEEVRALTSPEYRKRLAAKVQRELSELAANVGADQAKTMDISVGAGTPYFTILGKLKKEKMNLLVMSTQGKGFVDRALIGSTSERVLRAAECPVLLIPPANEGRSRRSVRGEWSSRLI